MLTQNIKCIYVLKMRDQKLKHERNTFTIRVLGKRSQGRAQPRSGLAQPLGTVLLV